MRYFDHDTTAGSDDKIIALRLDYGGAAVDAYWTLLEKIYENEAPIVIDDSNPEISAISVRLATDKRTLSEWLSGMVAVGLFEVETDNPKTITSNRAMDNIRIYNEKCEKARLAGKKGGRSAGQKANAKRTLSERQAKKRKEKKGMDSHKGYPIPNASAVAGADKPAPDEARTRTVPCCPNCGSTAIVGMPLHPVCPQCGDIAGSDMRYVEEVG